MSQLFASSGQGIRASASILPMNIQGWFPLGLTGWISMQSKGLWRVFSNQFSSIAQSCSTLCNPWNEKTLIPWKETYDNPRHCIKNQRHHFVDKGLYSQSHGSFSSHVMYGCERWTIKMAECWTDAFKLWCWRRLLRVPWTARDSNQSILKEINPEYSLEGLMLKLKLQYFGHLIWRANLLEKTLILGKIERKRGWGQQKVRWLDGIIDSMDMALE